MANTKTIVGLNCSTQTAARHPLQTHLWRIRVPSNRFIAEYEDGSTDVFAMPECTLGQGDVFHCFALVWAVLRRPLLITTTMECSETGSTHERRASTHCLRVHLGESSTCSRSRES